jgi:hypothetical protein
VLLALAASVTSLANGFAFDDLPVIVRDGRIHDLSRVWQVFTQPYWGPPAPPALYRPLTSLAFAVQWAIGGGSALPFHLLNVLLYCALCLAVYRLAVGLLGARPGWWAAAIFAVHPVHAEAVGNAVGQAELWAGLLVVLAVLRYVDARRQGELSPAEVARLAALYLAACSFKEHAIVLPALLGLAEVTVLDQPLAATLRRRDLRVLWAVLAVSAVGFWSVHVAAVGHLAGDRPNFVFWGMNLPQRLFTMLGIVPEAVRLLLFPVRLQAEYAPQEIRRAYGFGGGQLLGTALLAGIGLATAALRRNSALTFGVGWTAIALLPVSNVLVPSGVVLAERTLFLPTVGLALVVGAGAARLSATLRRSPPAPRRLALAGGVALLAAGVLRSAERQSVWRDNGSFTEHLLLDSPRSYRSHWVRANRLFAAHDPSAGERELATAIALFPDDPQLLAQLADRYRGSRRCSAAVPLYRRSLMIDRSRAYLRSRLLECLIRLGRLDEAQLEVRNALRRGEPRARQDSLVVAGALVRNRRE